MVLLVGCAATGPLRSGDFQDMVQDIEKKAHLVRQFRADFTKTRHTAVFNRDMTVKGRLIFQKPSKFLVTLTGDVNAELLSDGTTIHIVHDNKDQEVFQVQGERDQSRFADPLMLLINSIGQGGLRRFHPVHTETRGQLLTMEFLPQHETNFERIRSVTVQLSEEGEIRKVVIVSDDGEREEVVFDSWRMLAQDDPDLVDWTKGSRFWPCLRRAAPSRPTRMASGLCAVPSVSRANLLWRPIDPLAPARHLAPVARIASGRLRC